MQYVICCCLAASVVVLAMAMGDGDGDGDVDGDGDRDSFCRQPFQRLILYSDLSPMSDESPVMTGEVSFL